jgi:hypothetical protein
LPFITAGFNYGKFYKASKTVQYLEGANPIGFELRYTKMHRDEKSWQQNNCYFNTGIGLNYFNFDNQLLGESMALFYVFEPEYKLGKHLNLLVDANFGLTFLSNPYNKDKNANNSIYSLPISAYMALGTGMEYAVHKNFQISLLASFIHISNGGTLEPNKGINMSTLNMRLSYNPINNDLEKFTKKPQKLERKDRLDLGMYLSNKNMGTNEPDRYFIFGAFANYSKQIARMNALTTGIEFLTDRVTQARLEKENADKSSMRLGVLVGHEFLFGRFTVSQQLGCYLFNETNYFNMLYQRAGISTVIPNFTDLRVIYYIKK